jgi:hypothetical protein
MVAHAADPQPAARFVVGVSANYRIECVDRPDSPAEHRRHLTGIGTVDDDGVKRNWDDIAAVRDAMANGDTFYTKSHTTERTASVEAHLCGCGTETIRSNPADVADNNLDNMVPCPGRRPSTPRNA